MIALESEKNVRVERNVCPHVMPFLSFIYEAAFLRIYTICFIFEFMASMCNIETRTYIFHINMRI